VLIAAQTVPLRMSFHTPEPKSRVATA